MQLSHFVDVLVSRILGDLSTALSWHPWSADRTEMIWLSYRRVTSVGRIALASFRLKVVLTRLRSIIVVLVWRCHTTILDIAVWGLLVRICALLVRLLLRGWGVVTDPTGSRRWV